MTGSPWIARAGRLAVLAFAGMLAVLVLAVGRLDQPAAAGEAKPLRGASPAGVATLGDYVWYDTNRSGLPDPGETGIDNVVVALYQDDGDAVFEPGAGDTSLGQLATGDNPGIPGVDHGWYDFNIPATDALYWVVIAASNFAPGGVLEGHTLTSGSIIGESPLLVYVPLGVLDYNDADFGYVLDAIASPSPTASRTGTASPSATATLTPTATRTPSPTASATASATGTRTATPSPTSTSSPGSSPTATRTLTPSATASATGTPTATATPSRTASPAATATRTATSSPSATASQTSTASRTPTATATRTPTATGTSGPPPACTPDSYEVDDGPDAARLLPLGEPVQTHSFHTALDFDWFRFEGLTPGWSYAVRTSNLKPGTDTYMELFSATMQQIATNDDIDVALCVGDAQHPGLLPFCASAISWTAATSGPYYLQVRTLIYESGTCPGYDIAARALRSWVPEFPEVMPTGTPTPTPTQVPSATATSTVTRTRTPTATRPPTKTPTPTATIVVPPGIEVPDLLHPKALAIDPNTRLVYITSRDNNQLIVINGLTYEVVNRATVGSEPWGVAVNPATNKVYVANFASGDVYVLDATTLDLLAVVAVGPKPTFVKINPITNRVFVVTYGNQSLVVIDGANDVIEHITPNVGVGAWGLAVNPNLNRVYVASRDSGNIVTLDGTDNYRILDGQTVKPCGGAGSAPYSIEFNPLNDKLYVACSPFQNVNSAAIYQVGSVGMWRRAFIAIGKGGEDAGGGLAVNPTTSHVFFTNSLANSVSVVSGASDQVIATEPVGLDPFGIAVDGDTGRVFVGNRVSNNLNVFPDPFR